MTNAKRLGLQIALLLITFVTTTLAGAEWMHALPLDRMSWEQVLGGTEYSIPFLLILTFHEFGHYFTARYYKIGVTLPYYIPMYLGSLFISLGTFGAFIRIKEEIKTRQEYFDVGIAGPLAGFVVALAVLFYGFTHLPDPEYVYEIHPEYESFGLDYEVLYDMDTVLYKKDFVNPDRMNYNASRDSVRYYKDGISITIGSNLLFYLMKEYVVEDKSLIPNDHEIMHYPLLLAGYLALFFTAINLFPIGQLDGGHIVFGLFGQRYHAIISKTAFMAFLFYTGLGVISPQGMVGTSTGSVMFFLFSIVAYVYFLFICLYRTFEDVKERWLAATIIMSVQFAVTSLFHLEFTGGMLLFALLIGRFLGTEHPGTSEDKPLNAARVALGVIALIVFVLSYCPEIFIVT
ncbi:MAG: site-2 protease family protein [Bacteroidota bacterium]